MAPVMGSLECMAGEMKVPIYGIVGRVFPAQRAHPKLIGTQLWDTFSLIGLRLWERSA